MTDSRDALPPTWSPSRSRTGIGLTVDQRGRVSQRFSQAGESTTRRFCGTGLALTVTRAFARKLVAEPA